MTIANLPEGFPTVVHVTFEKELFRDKFQLFALYEHDGKKYKLIPVYEPPFDRLRAYEGDSYAVMPKRSPNGHIVFCSVIKEVTAEHVTNSILATTREAIKQRTNVTIARFEGTTNIWCHDGIVTDAVVEKDELRLILSRCKLDHFDFSIEGVAVNYLSGGLSLHVKLGGDTYHVWFHAKDRSN